MPFRSKKQQRYMWKFHPGIAREWTERYGPFRGGKKGWKRREILGEEVFIRKGTPEREIDKFASYLRWMKKEQQKPKGGKKPPKSLFMERLFAERPELRKKWAGGKRNICPRCKKDVLISATDPGTGELYILCKKCGFAEHIGLTSFIKVRKHARKIGRKRVTVKKHMRHVFRKEKEYGRKVGRNPLQSLVGNVYRNFMTGNEWKIVKIRGMLITLRNKEGLKFDTTPELMANYNYIGKKFS